MGARALFGHPWKPWAVVPGRTAARVRDEVRWLGLAYQLHMRDSYVFWPKPLHLIVGFLHALPARLWRFSVWTGFWRVKEGDYYRNGRLRLDFWNAIKKRRRHRRLMERIERYRWHQAGFDEGREAAFVQLSAMIGEPHNDKAAG